MDSQEKKKSGRGARSEELEMEVALLTEALGRAQSRIAELTILADRDPLAGVLNRRAFLRELERAIAAHRRHGHKAVLVMVAAQGLRDVNDANGRAAGDAALVHIGKTIAGHVRTTDAVGRLSGDDFGVVLAFADEGGAVRKMEKLTEILCERPFVHGGRTLNVTTTCAVRPLTEDTAEEQLAIVAAMIDEKNATSEAA